MYNARLDENREYSPLLAEPPHLEQIADTGKRTFTELIPQTVVEGLCALAKQEKVSSTITLLAAFAILIHRYTQMDEPISIDVSIFPESYPMDAFGSKCELATLTRPISVSFNGEMSLHEVIQQVSNATSAIFTDDTLPCLLTEGIPPLGFTWHESEEAFGGSLSVILQAHNGLVTELFYERLLANSEPIVQTGSHWQTLLSAICCDPETHICSLPLLGPDERSQLLKDWRGSIYDGELTKHECLHHLFEAQASVRPDRTALMLADKQLTYGELDQKANQLARYLRSRGVKHGSTVGLYLPRSMEVYIAMLGILKAGAAYVPIDPEYPSDRIAYMMEDCDVAALVTTSEMTKNLEATDRCIVCLDIERESIRRELSHAITSSNVGPDDLAYIIYTSGSTGRPKGVQIQHKSVCNLVRAEGRIFRVLPEDRVYQGFSVAFDASIEEIWLAFFAGATLVIGTSEMMHAGPALAGMLTEAGITVLSCVPTLLSMMDDDIPTLRLLILGGEAFTDTLAIRWSKEGRRLVNTYGPTEATVIATYADCHPGEQVSIGRPVPNYSVYVLDENLQPVPVGVPGELHIGGVGLSRGYVGRDDLTAEKFIPNPFAEDTGAPAKLYKTGDLVRFSADGNIEFLGRTDTQVKIRGFRVEPSEIECILNQCAGVQNAAVSIRKDMCDIQQIVAYVVPRRDETFDESVVKAELRSSLPPYMIPSVFVVLEKFPTLASGKIDRKHLPVPEWQLESPKCSCDARNDIEAKIMSVWERLFFPQQVSVEDDFFDLGGHSLLAARMVSELRKDPAMRRVAMLDVYHHPKLEDFAKRVAETASEDDVVQAAEHAKDESTRAANAFHIPSKLSFYACSIAQAIGLYISFGIFAFPWLAAYFAAKFTVTAGYGLVGSALIIEAVFVAITPLLMLISIASKWILIGRYKEGSYPVWGWYYWRFWMARKMGTAPLTYLRGTPLLTLYCRMMGAKIGSNVYLGTPHFYAFDLIEIGDDTSIGMEAQLPGYTVENGMLKIDHISIGKRCYVGTKSVLMPGTSMGDDSKLADQSMLPEGYTIPQTQEWVGSPASFSKQVTNEQPAGSPSRLETAIHYLLYMLSVVVFLPTVTLVAGIPGIILIFLCINRFGTIGSLWFTPIAAASFAVCLSLEIAALKWLLVGHVKAGKYSVRSMFYVRKWFVDSLMQMSLTMLHSLYATLYLPPWFRMLGSKLGRRVEISTAAHISPDLLTLGAESFVADSACLGAPYVHLGYLTMEPTSIGRRSFIGNSALAPAASEIGDECLIGCMSVPPSNDVLKQNPDSSWLGSPPVMLPRRQESAEFPDNVTFNPPLSLCLIRGFIEFFRITIPLSLFIAMSILLIRVAIGLDRVMSAGAVIAVFPLVYFALGSVMFVIAAGIKWIVMGKYKPCVRPLWSHFVWRTEMVTAIHESFCAPFLLNQLQGTPFISPYFRLLGSKIGARVYMETTQITEFDMVEVGDDVALNLNATLQTHLFEDRVMKVSKLRVGDKANVGTMAVVLYDSEMHEGASLDGLSLLMKGETLPAWTKWEGIPARRAK